jgi:hypothetical protein
LFGYFGIVVDGPLLTAGVAMKATSASTIDIAYTRPLTFAPQRNMKDVWHKTWSTFSGEDHGASRLDGRLLAASDLWVSSGESMNLIDSFLSRARWLPY